MDPIPGYDPRVTEREDSEGSGAESEVERLKERVKELDALVLANDGCLVDAPALAVRERELREIAEAERDQWQAENTELKEALLDAVNRSCLVEVKDNRYFVDDGALSEYQHIIALLVLEGLGLAKKVSEKPERWELIWPTQAGTAGQPGAEITE